jgi:hypothetical protein
MPSGCPLDLWKLWCEGKFNSSSVFHCGAMASLVVSEEESQAKAAKDGGRERSQRVAMGSGRKQTGVDSKPLLVDTWWGCFHVESGLHTAGAEQLRNAENQETS